MHDPMVVAFEIGGLVTVWHREPGGRDAGEVCRQYRRGPNNEVVVTWGWKLHVHHWRIRFPLLRRVRRRLLTRCTWCGEGHRRRSPVNTSSVFAARFERYWLLGERNLYHSGCLTYAQAWDTCDCGYRVEHDPCSGCSDCGLRVPRSPGEAARVRMLRQGGAGCSDPWRRAGALDAERCLDGR